MKATYVAFFYVTALARNGGKGKQQGEPVKWAETPITIANEQRQPLCFLAGADPIVTAAQVAATLLVASHLSISWRSRSNATSNNFEVGINVQAVSFIQVIFPTFIV